VKFKVGVFVNQEGVEAFKSGGFVKMHGWRSKCLITITKLLCLVSPIDEEESFCACLSSCVFLMPWFLCFISLGNKEAQRRKLDEKMSIRSWKKKVQGGIGFLIYFLGFNVFLSIFWILNIFLTSFQEGIVCEEFKLFPILGFQQFKLTSFEGGIRVWGKCEKVFNKLSKVDFGFVFSIFGFWAFKILVPSNLCPYVRFCVCVKKFGVFWCLFFLLFLKIVGMSIMMKFTSVWLEQ